MSVSQSVVHSLCGVSSLFISFRDKNFPLIADIFIIVSMCLSFWIVSVNVPLRVSRSEVWWWLHPLTQLLMTCICNLPMVVFVLRLEINLIKVLFSSDLTLELHIVIQVITGVLTVTVTTLCPLHNWEDQPEMCPSCGERHEGQCWLTAGNRNHMQPECTPQLDVNLSITIKNYKSWNMKKKISFGKKYMEMYMFWFADGILKTCSFWRIIDLHLNMHLVWSLTLESQMNNYRGDLWDRLRGWRTAANYNNIHTAEKESESFNTESELCTSSR